MDVVSPFINTETSPSLSLSPCRENDLSEMDIPQFFVVERDRFGKLLHKELKPDGQDEMVTNDNKEEYVRQVVVSQIWSCVSVSHFCRLYVQFRFRDGIEKQFLALQKGFHELIPAHLLKDFDERELELLISGLGKVDVVDWKNNTRLKNCTPDTDTIKWFWQVCCRVADIGHTQLFPSPPSLFRQWSLMMTRRGLVCCSL